MDKELFQKALELNDGGERICKESLNHLTIAFINKFNIHDEVTDFLRTFSFNRNIRFKHVYFDKVNDIADNNTYESNIKCILEGLLIIGSGLNGDLIVFDLINQKVGYVFHDDLWEDESINPRDIFISLNCTIGEFYYKSMIDEDFPVDGLQAEQYIS
ncbi:hypothetical protein [Clostridium intestinale]|uniref:SUKH-3 immunity protein n=1 Tax=Clostridium intestinale DSM 6191 TaxID=1121320 RepID=A0A1M6AN07_9CLOT|nr:hypothetical protein [Clostridium intestinale]SHI37811.1 hypothetical protein SAMN02745941_03709 [Clostridium intestinale DSM 6191]